MDVRQTGLGVVLVLFFWAMQAKYIDLGPLNWVLGGVVLVVVFYLIGKGVMPKPSEEIKELRMFLYALVIVFSVLCAFGPAFIPGVVLPPAGFDMSPLIIGMWLMLFGAYMFVIGWLQRWAVTSLVGVFWLFSAFQFVSAVSWGPNSWIHFGLVVGLPFIIYGLIKKD